MWGRVLGNGGFAPGLPNGVTYWRISGRDRPLAREDATAARRRYAGERTAPGLIHLSGSVVAGNPGQIAQADFKSTDGGATWPVVTWVAPAYTPFPLGGCYAGDYEGNTSDLAHGRFFSAWGQPLPGTSTYAIVGNTNDP